MGLRQLLETPLIPKVNDRTEEHSLTATKATGGPVE